MASLLHNMNLEVLKLPLGFIRVVQIPFIIIAFASMGGWSISFDYTFTCQDAERRSEKIIIDTFKLTTITVHNDSCAEIHEMVPLFNENITSSPGFFVFTGIVSLLFVLGILVVYLFFWGLYESNNLFAMIDFGVTALLTLFWFIGTICWWAGASAVGEETSEESIIKLLTIDNACHNDKPQCTVAKEGGYGSLVISVFAGWACVLLFAANCWFIFKETIWFRNRQSPPTISSPTTGVAQTQQQGGYHA